MLTDRDIPGMGDHSPPPEPDCVKASETALIYAAYEDAEECVAVLKEIAQYEDRIYHESIGVNPDLQVLGDYIGLWYDIYVSAKDALAEGLRLKEQQKQQGG